MSPLEMICTLRERLLIHVETRNVHELTRLNETFAALREIAYAAGEAAQVDILTDLEYAAGYAMIGATEQAANLIPDEAEIRSRAAGDEAGV